MAGSGTQWRSDRGSGSEYALYYPYFLSLIPLSLLRQIVFHDGFKMQFRAGETTAGCGTELLCPNQFCPTNQSPRSDPRQAAEVDALLAQRRAELTSRRQTPDHQAIATTKPPPPPSPPPANVFVMYSTLVFTYEWPTADTPSKEDGQQAPGSLKARLAELTGLLADGIITVEEHDGARRAALGILGAL